MRSRLVAGVSALVLLASLSACGDDDEGSNSAGDDNTTAESTPSEESSPAETDAAPTDAAPSGTGVSCDFVAGGSPARPVDPPAGEAAFTGQVPAVIKTSVGDLKVTLDADKAPCTVTSFASLAEQGYYDNSSCHRQGNSPGFEFLQCGDPNFDPAVEQPDPSVGSGGPGYTVPDELDGSETYPAGTLAMANTGQANTGGGQFFIVFGDSGFPPSYTVWGQVDAGSIDLLKQAAASGNDGVWGGGSGRPNTPVTFTGIEVG